jgi:ankyrin repeat protein
LNKNVKLIIEKSQDQTKLDEALRRAVRSGDYEKVSALLYKGADRLSPDPIDHYNSLKVAARTGHLDILKKLLENDKDHKLFLKYSESLLVNAAEEQQIDMVRYLTQKIGPAKKIYDYPLFRLTESDDAEILKLMVQQGADINAVAKWYNETPLIYAAKMGKTKAVKFLLQHGANINTRDGKGFTALDHARNEGYNEIVQMLTQSGGKATSRAMGSPLFNSEVLGNPERLKELLRHGADLKARDSYGWTPLLSAINYGFSAAATIMIEFGADVNDSGDMMTPYPPLVAATEFSRNELIKLLVSKGADVNAVRSYDGRSALILATSKNNLPMVKYLLAHGARKDIKDRLNKTVEDYARESGYTDILNALTKK